MHAGTDAVAAVGAASTPREDEDAFVRAVACAALTGLAVTLLATQLLPGWVGATIGVAQGLGWCSVLVLRRPRRWIRNVVLFGLAAGAVELGADVWLVRVTGALHYPAEGPFLLDSPAYMPAAWFGMLSAGIALGVVVRRTLSLGASTLLVALATGIYIPVYEALALRAGWWSYSGPVLLSGAVPPFIALGEVLLALPLVAATERLLRCGPSAAVALGAAQGVWILVSYVVAWELLAG